MIEVGTEYYGRDRVISEHRERTPNSEKGREHGWELEKVSQRK